MALGTFRDSIRSIAPPWLLDPVGELVLWTAGAMPDVLNEWVRQGVRARMPGAGTPTALPFLGADRQIERGPEESDESYAARIRRAFDSWRIAGSPFELLAQLRAFFLPSPPPLRIVSDRSVWHTIDPTSGAVTKIITSPRNWAWDALSSSASTPPGSPRWWRAWAIIDSSAGPWEQWFLGEPNVALGGGRTLGSTATEEEVASVRRIVRRWKPANVHIVNVIVTFTASLYEATDPPGAPMPAEDHDLYENRAVDAAFWEGVTT